MFNAKLCFSAHLSVYVSKRMCSEYLNTLHLLYISQISIFITRLVKYVRGKKRCKSVRLDRVCFCLCLNYVLGLQNSKSWWIWKQTEKAHENRLHTHHDSATEALGSPIPSCSAQARTQSDQIHECMSSFLYASSCSLFLHIFFLSPSLFYHAQFFTPGKYFKCQTYADTHSYIVSTKPTAFSQIGLICDFSWFINERKNAQQ